MISMLKMLALTILVGSNSSYWGYTYLAEGNNKVYALRSLEPTSSLCVFDASTLAGREGVIELASLKVPMKESVTSGTHSCHITLLSHEAVVADYTSGTLSLFSLDTDGYVKGEPRLLHFEGKGVHPTRQEGPHIHSSALSPDGKTLVVVDLGTDRIYRFAVENGRLVTPHHSYVSLPAGCGPRFSVFSKDGKYLYVVTELTDEILVYRTTDYSLQGRYSLSGEISEGGAHIALSPDGKYLYASQRVSSAGKEKQCKAPDGVAIYKCFSNGKLEKLQYLPTGGHPRHFAISPDGAALVVACRDSNTIEIFPLNKKSGKPVGDVEKIKISEPVYIGFR